MIEVTSTQIEKAQKMLSSVPEGAHKALSRAINRAAETARTEAARKVRQTYYIGYSDVTSTIRIKLATPGNLSASVVSRGNLTALPKFRVTPKQPEPKRKKPIQVRVKRGDGGPIKKAFVARMKSGHIGVFNRAGKMRFPIDQRFGPSVPQMLGNEKVGGWVEQKAQERLEERIDHEINWILVQEGK